MEQQLVALRPKQLAELLGISFRALANDRASGRPKIPYVKHGRSVLYLWEDVQAFLQANRVDSKS